jgi:hypothetical protein
MMGADTRVPTARPIPVRAVAVGFIRRVLAWLRALRGSLAASTRTCAAYYAAAARYESLNGLSDAELRRRGMARETLARDLCPGSDRASA